MLNSQTTKSRAELCTTRLSVYLVELPSVEGVETFNSQISTAVTV